MNKFFSKIAIGLASFAMVVGVSVAVSNKEYKAVSAAADSVSFSNIGNSKIEGGKDLPEVSTPTEFYYDANYTFKYCNGKKQNEAVLLTKKKGYLFNVTEMPGTITAVTVKTHSGAASAAKYGVAFSTTEYTSFTTNNTGTVNIKNDKSYEFKCSVTDAKYFCIYVDSSTDKNGQVKDIVVNYTSSSGSTDPEISFSKDAINGEEGDEFEITYSADNLTSDITWSPASDATDIIDYVVDAENKKVTGTMLKEGSVTLTATSGTVSDSVTFNVAKHYTNRKYTVNSTYEVIESGDTMTGATTTYRSTYSSKEQLTGGKNMSLKITGLTKKVSINKLILSMHSNQSAGSGSISVKIDGGTENFIAGTSSSVGATFDKIGNNTAYGTSYRDVTWDGLTYVAKSSIEITIYCTVNSLYCNLFDIFFEESENADVVTALTVTPNTWTGYDSQVLQVKDFKVSVTTNGAEGSAVDYKFLGIGYKDGEGNFVARDANFIYGNPQVADKFLCWKAEYPTTAGGSEYLYAYVTLNVSADTVASVVVSKDMGKTSYYTNDEWNGYGLLVTAVYASGNEQDVTGFATYNFYSDSDMTSEVATPEALGVGDNQKVYVKATYEGISNEKGYAQIVSISIEHGSLITDPLTADEAIKMGKDLKYATDKEYYIRGIVSEVSALTETYATFFLQDSSEEYSFEAFKIKFDENCKNHDDLRVGADVLIKTTIRKFSNTVIENGQNEGSILSITFTKTALENIALDKENLVLAVGDEYTLTATALPLGAELETVTWASLDNNVATVDQDGKVTAVANGSTTITATSGEITARCNVVVSTKATLEYKGTTTVSANAYTDAELTDALGLDGKMFNVHYDNNGATTQMSLNVEGAIRMYATKGTTDGNKFTVSIDKKFTINSIKITFVSGYDKTAEISNRYGAVKDNDGQYAINGDEFTVFNNNKDVTSNTQVRISKIEIYYGAASTQALVENSSTQTSLAYHYEGDAENGYELSNIVMRFGGKVSKELWNELDTDEHKITGFGVMVADGSLIESFEDFYSVIDVATPSTESEDIANNYAIDYFVPVADMASKIGEDANNYFWNLRVSVDESKMNTMYSAIAYIKLGDEYVLMNMARESVKTLAADYLDNRGYDKSAAAGSLQFIVQYA